MRRHPALASLLAFLVAAALLAPGSARAQAPFNSTEGRFTVQFPVQPEKSVNKHEHSVLTGYMADDGDIFYIANYIDYDSPVTDVNDELEGTADATAQQLDGKVTSRKFVKFTRGPGAPRQAMEFVFDSKNLAGNGIVITESRRTYLVVGFARKPRDGSTQINRFLNSFRIMGAREPGRP